MDARPAVLMPGLCRFPPPWAIDEAIESFCIRDANGQAPAYVQFLHSEEHKWIPRT